MEAGDKIFITEKLKYYIKKYGWPIDMYDMIGKTFKAYRFDTKIFGGMSTNIKVPMVCITFGFEHWYIPADCYILDRIRKIDMIFNEN